MEFTAERARELFDYNPETGDLVWRVDRGGKIKSGVIAGCKITTNCGKSYIQVNVHKKTMYAHRVVWLHQTGKWPECEIDHIDGDGTNNRIENLRDVPHRLNGKNTRRRVDNTSGCTGVMWVKAKRKWRAKIKVNGEYIHLGMYTDKQAAIAARKAAERKFRFHQNHGQDRPL